MPLIQHELELAGNIYATGARIATLVDELKIRAKKRFFIINRSWNRLADSLQKEPDHWGRHLAGIIPKDDLLFECDVIGNPTIALSPEDPALRASFEIFDKILNLP
jgi:CO dehydrogenase maturation factor